MDFSEKIAPELYQEDAFDVAQKHLLGSYLCSNVDGKLTVGMITELEVYIGASDRACHAYPNKLTPRTATMFRAGGCAYVFFVYGMYNQFNVVVGPKGTANAVLIRSLEPITGLDVMKERRHCDNIKNLTTGPGKLCQALGITKQQHDGIDLCGKEIWISPRQKDVEFFAKPRVGIDYAGKDKDNPWRYLIKDNHFISKG